MDQHRIFADLFVSAAAILSGVLGWAYAVEPRRLRLERVSVPIPDLTADLDGFRIGLLTDLHLGPMVSPAQVRKAATLLMAERPDLVLIAGDFLSNEAALHTLAEALAPVGSAFGVLGNWDYNRVKRLQAAIPQVRILVNEGVLVRPGLWLAGVDDLQRGKPDLDRALTLAPLDGVRILLSHEPDFANQVLPSHHIALQLSGHSHGGQVRIPFVGPLLLPPGGRKYHTGLNQAPACLVYTSRGVGMVRLPIRFACPPEVTILTLQKATAD